MNKIKDITEIEKYLKSKEYTDSEISDFICNIKPFYDFYDYMLETHKMDYDMVEKDSSEFSQSIFNEYLEILEKSEDKMKYMFEICGDIMKRYANKYDYTDSEKVKDAMNKYNQILFVDVLSKDK